jgi:hypothetical protein
MMPETNMILVCPQSPKFCQAVDINLVEFNNIGKSFHVLAQTDKTMAYVSFAPLET